GVSDVAEENHAIDVRVVEVRSCDDHYTASRTTVRRDRRGGQGVRRGLEAEHDQGHSEADPRYASAHVPAPGGVPLQQTHSFVLSFQIDIHPPLPFSTAHSLCCPSFLTRSSSL